MANYDLTYEGSEVQKILDSGDELQTNGYIFMGEATPQTVLGTPTERVVYICGPGTQNTPVGFIGVLKWDGISWINTLVNIKVGNGATYKGVAAPSTDPGSPTGKEFYVAVQAGAYTNFLNSSSQALAVTKGINILVFDGTAWTVEQPIAIDEAPTAGSPNLVESGGTFESIIQNGPAFDLSAYNAVGGVPVTYADLSAAITAMNSLPASFKKGGMSMKFVRTSDNKYVQYRLLTQNFSIDPSDWQGIVEILYGNKVSKTYSATAGSNLNTTSSGLNVDVPAGKKVVIQLSSDIEGLLYQRVNIFYARINNSWVSQSIAPIFGALNEYVFDSNVTAFGFFLIGSNIPANGNITISAELESEIGINKQLQILKEGVQKLEECVELKADKEQNYNLFNPNSSDIVSGSYINGSAGIVSNSSYIITQPFALAPGESITSNKLGRGVCATLFKSASDLNSGIAVFAKTNTTPCTLTNTTNTTLYARFSLNANNTEVIINKGTASLPYAPYYASNPPKVLYEGNLNFITQELGNDTEKVISQAKMTNLLGLDFDGDKVSRSFNTTVGTTLNTTSSPILFTIKKNEIFYCKLVGDSSNQNAKISIFYYRVNGSWVNANGKVPALLQGKVYALTVPSDTDAVGVFSSGSEHETGTLQLVLWHNVSIPDLVKRNNIKSCTLKDIVKNWMNGEKSPIAFIGDSTTDGTSTTGWTVTDSHPGQDAQNWLLNTPEGQAFETDKTWEERVYDAHMLHKGCGTVDYVWQKAYPYLLEQLIQKELGNNNARVYNIGYYGNTLSSFESVPVYFGDVYSDTKMAGIVLGINDRNSNTPGEFYVKLLWQLENYVIRLFEQGIIPFMVTNQFVTQSNATGTGNYSIMYADNIQALTNRAKIEVARKYNLEVIDMNSFDQLVFRASSYLYNNLTENLHFKDLGHVLEAGFLFTQLIPWINYTEDAYELYVGFNGCFNKSDFQIGGHATVVNDRFKRQINYSREVTTDICIFDSYVFNDSVNGAYTVKYLTPVASGYIVIDGDTSNPISLSGATQVGSNYELDLGTWDIGLHHVQVYTGNNAVVAFKGFLLEQQN